jgi:methionyl-tRNA formyltransferase
MRAGFAGTPEFAARALAALQEGGYTIPLVLTQPDRPSGRGMTVVPSPVKRFALAHALRVEQPPSLTHADVQSALRDVELDVLVVAAYGLILPQPVLDWPRRGCLNIHASLLPRWRGAAPIARALEAGDAVTGITIMRMDAGLDTGPMLRRESIPVAAAETAGTLHDRLATLGARMIVETLRLIEQDGVVEATPQPATGVTYAAKIDRAERRIDWTETATVLDRKVRAFSPAPGATAAWGGSAVRIVAATVPNSQSGDPAPGTVVRVTRAGIDVACGAHTTLRLTAVQPAGGRAMTAAAFAAGRGVVAGVPFGP